MEIKLFSARQEAQQFERLAGECERQVYATCYHMMGNREDAQDCAQETMLRAYRSFGSFRRDAAFSTWITRIAMNVCVDELRKRREHASLDAMREDTGFDVADKGPGVYARLEERERMRLLREGLQKLPPDMRQAMILRDLQGREYEEIARILDIAPGTVKSRINRARNKLCEILKESAELFSSPSV